MKISQLTFILFLCLNTTSVFAEAVRSCLANGIDKNTKAVDLRNEMPPLRDQDSVGWCYGFTAADLLSHYLFKTKGKNLLGNKRDINYSSQKNSVSAMGVSTAYNEVRKSNYSKGIKGISLSELSKMNKKVFAEGGSVAEAIMAAKEKGLCFEKDVSSEDFGFVEDYRCAIKNHCVISDIMNIIYDTKTNPTCHELTSIKKVFPELNLKAIQKVLSVSARENAIANLVNASCTKHFAASIFRNKKGPDINTLTVRDNVKAPALIKNLDEQLDKGIPVGIMYLADFLTMPGNGKKIHHASTIVGKRFNPKTCEVEYLLRNSWGVGCGNYRQENPAMKKCISELNYLFKAPDGDKAAAQKYFNGVLACHKNFPALPRNPRVVCEDSSSHVIVRKSDLEKNIYNVTSLKEDENYFLSF